MNSDELVSGCFMDAGRKQDSGSGLKAFITHGTVGTISSSLH